MKRTLSEKINAKSSLPKCSCVKCTVIKMLKCYFFFRSTLFEKKLVTQKLIIL